MKQWPCPDFRADIQWQWFMITHSTHFSTPTHNNKKLLQIYTHVARHCVIQASLVSVCVCVEDGEGWYGRHKVNLIKMESNVVAAELAANSSRASVCWMNLEDQMALIYSRDPKPNKKAVFASQGLVCWLAEYEMMGTIEHLVVCLQFFTFRIRHPSRNCHNLITKSCRWITDGVMSSQSNRNERCLLTIVESQVLTVQDKEHKCGH